MHPFFDPATFSDDDLNEKIAELSRRLTYAYNFVGDQQMIDQLSLLLESLEFEQQARYHQEFQKMWDAQFPDVIESDPDFNKPKEETKINRFADTEEGKKPKVAPVFQKTYRKK